MRLNLAAGLLLLALTVAPAPVRSQIAVPELRSRVTDLTGTLARSDESTIEDRLRAFEQKHGSQIAVLIVPTTEPETIEQYSMRVAESWKLGRKGIDDGALLLVALKDRAIRIEVGYGLEGVLNDATCKRIVAEIITPDFRRGDFRAGIEAGVEQMMRVIEGEALPPPPQGEGKGGDTSNLLFVVAFAAIGAAHALRPVLGRLGAALVIGLGAAITSSFLVSSSGALLIGVAVFVLALFASPAGAWTSDRRYARGRGFGPGGSGGGFRGGGGGFGGGGASGRW